MAKNAASLAEVRELGLEVLERELGPVGMVRFLQQFEAGHGDYTKERGNWLPGGDVDSVAALVQGQRRRTE